MCVFSPALYNSEQGFRRGAGKAEQLQFTSVKNSKSPEDKGSCLRSSELLSNAGRKRNIGSGYKNRHSLFLKKLLELVKCLRLGH